MAVAPVVEGVRSASRPGSPYVGLVPYEEGDAAFFFGRSTEAAIVAMNLRAARLTVLYGPSGVGKSSLLMAGAVHKLHGDAQRAGTGSRFAVCVFRSWRDDPVHGIRAAAADALEVLDAAEPLASPTEALAETLRAWTGPSRTLLVVLDQFEEYFQYHPAESGGEQMTGFAAELARIVNDPTLPVNVLLSIREDAWAKLDRFKGHIPALFSNYVRVDHLDLDAAREAIAGPIDAWNKALRGSEQPFEIELELVKAVLAATAGGGLTLSAGGESLSASAAGDRVEAPFLQLVLDRLWRETVAAGAHTLTLARLESLGGAARIVENHLRDALGRLTAAEQDAAADCFRFLVSRSKTKIAHPASDLAEWTKRPEPEVTAVLDRLCSGESGRILRAVAPARAGGSTSYELFHDILAEPVLAWRKQHEQRREQEAEAARQRAARRQLILFGSVALGLAALFAALAAAAFVQRHHAVALLREKGRSNEALSQRIRALSGTDAAASRSEIATRKTLVLLRGTNGSLTTETAALKRARDRLDRRVAVLRGTNRPLRRELDRLNDVANPGLVKRIRRLRGEFVQLLTDGEELSGEQDSLQADASTLKTETKALQARDKALQSENRRLEQRKAALGLPPTPPFTSTLGATHPPLPTFSPVAAERFRVPGDTAGDDRLRRRVEGLERRLGLLLEQRAREENEAGWLRRVNRLLRLQRTALRAETGQLEQTRAVLGERRRELRQALVGARSENRRLSSLAVGQDRKNEPKRKATKARRAANARLQTKNNGQVANIGDLQSSIGSWKGRNHELAGVITPHLNTMLRGAQGLPGQPVVGALLAVDAYRVAPYDPDDPAHPAVYNALWAALKRLDSKAAQTLAAAPRSGVVEKKVCSLVGRSPTPDETSQLRRFLPSSARPTLLRPCG